jgi:hypothetical protein
MRSARRLGGVVEHDHEFLAAESEQVIGAAEASLHELGDQQQHFVAEQMAMAVVDQS